MFHETSYAGLGALGAACPPGQVNDYDPETGLFSELCVDDTLAYQSPVGAPGHAPGSTNITPKKADDWTSYAIYGAIALGALLLLGGKR